MKSLNSRNQEKFEQKHAKIAKLAAAKTPQLKQTTAFED
jgi:hypothetical protein